MKFFIKLFLVFFCISFTQNSLSAQQTEENPATEKKIRLLVGTSNLSPYITDIIPSRISWEIQDGEEVTKIIKALAAYEKDLEITVVAPMMLDMYKDMKKNNIKETGTYIKVPMPFGEKGKSVEMEVMLYETVTDYGVKIIFVGEPYQSGLFNSIGSRELAYQEKALEKYSFLSKAILEIAKLNGNDYYDVIHTLRWTTSMVPWYKKYWPRYSVLTANTVHTFFNSDILAMNANVEVNDNNKTTLQIDDKYYNEFVEGSIAGHNKIKFNKLSDAADLHTSVIYIGSAESHIDTIISTYKSLLGEKDVVDLYLNDLKENVLKGADPDSYIQQNTDRFGNTEFLDALIKKVESAETLSEKLDLCNKANTIILALDEIKYPVNKMTRNTILYEMERGITADVEEQQRNNIMSYLKTKGIESKKDAISYFENNFFKILSFAKSGDDLDLIITSKEDMLALTAIYIFVFEDNAAFLSKESYTMFMGTTINEGLDGLLNYLEMSASPIFRFYKTTASILLVCNPLNDNMSNYYVQGIENDAPKDFISFIENTSIGLDFANKFVADKTEIELVYKTEALKKVLPKENEFTTKFKAIESIVKK